MDGEACSLPAEPSSQAETVNCGAHAEETDQEFQFLRCDRCQADVPKPTLLPCLHNLCSQCLEETTPIGLCAICGTPHFHHAETPERQDNLFFAHLQAKLRLYRKVTGSRDSVCDNCKKEAVFWCSSCEEFLCVMCFQIHQRYLKRESHETKRLKDLQTESCKDFLSTVRKPNAMFCSNEGHKNQILSLYCRHCNQPMCTVCALLDSKHMGQHCDIHQEIQYRQEELQNLSAELKEKKNSCDNSYSFLEELVKNMEMLRNETVELIQQKIGEMVQMLQEKGQGFLAEVDTHHDHQMQDVKKKMQEMEGVVQRITASQKLVEKLQLYASDQEVLEIHPFLRQSLAELKKKQPSTVDCRTEVRNFTEIKAQLQDLLEGMTKGKEAVPVKSERGPQEDHWERPPVKRKYIQEERNTQNYPEMIKTEPISDEEWDKLTDEAFSSLMNQPGTSFGSTGGGCVAGSQSGLRQNMDDGLRITYGCSELSNSEDATLVNISTEEEETTDDETGGSGLPLDINSKSPGSQNDLVKYPFIRSESLDLDSGTIVFFDLKSLPGNVVHLVALVDETTTASAMISSPLKNTSSPCKIHHIGLNTFLEHLSTLHRPILVGYKVWSMDLPALIDALQKLNQLGQFEASILGFLDALPLIKEKFPEISNYTLKNLDSKYLWGQLDETEATDCVHTLKNLCTVLEINPVTQRVPVISCSSFRCYSSLQPLLCKKVLSKPSAQTLALHNISLFKLQSVYQDDPEKGLLKLSRYLNSRRRIGEKKVLRLSRIRTYFQNLLSSV